MGKYSSDSDSEKRGGKSTYKSKSRRRSSSSSSSDSRVRKRKSDRRSGSRSRTDKYSRSGRSVSKNEGHKSKSRRRSRSKDRSRYNKRSKSRDRHRRSRSKTRNRSNRSRSRSYIKEFVSKPKEKSTSKSTSPELTARRPNISEIEVKSEPYPSKFPEMSTVDSKVLTEINEDSFAPKPFSSSKSTKKLMDNIVIDLKKQTIKVPEVEPVEPDSIFHHNLFLNEEARMEKWIKELYGFRQKALQQGLKNH